ncbi:MAG: hypothetical protein R3F60_15910 [bacterium]
MRTPIQLLALALAATPAIAEPVISGRVLLTDADVAAALQTGLRVGYRSGRLDLGGELTLGMRGEHPIYTGETRPASEQVDVFVDIGAVAVVGVALLDVAGLRWTLEAGVGPRWSIPVDAGEGGLSAQSLLGTHLLLPVGDAFGGHFSIGVGLEARSRGLEHLDLGGGAILTAVVFDPPPSPRPPS